MIKKLREQFEIKNKENPALKKCISFSTLCSNLQELLLINQEIPALTKEDFVKEVEACGWEWNNFESQLREIRELTNNIIDIIYERI